MNVILYNELREKNIPGFAKLKKYLVADDFKSADVKKVAPNLYRARLDIKNRILFTIRHDDHNHAYALVVEYLPNHSYEKSRFLHRGAEVDEDKMEVVNAVSEFPQTPLRYLNATSETFHILDKIISFDDDQNEIFRCAPPLIIIGSAGSGKTALGLEKMKEASGEVLYVTKSAYLAQHSRNLYYSNSYENEAQNVTFLSYMEFIESLQIPSGKEMDFAIFKEWFKRNAQKIPLQHGHKIFEEFKGVITGAPTDKPWLGEDEYLSLGIKQSIFGVPERKEIYDLFKRYLTFLREQGYFDLNILSFEYKGRATPLYDFMIIDEVQDVTNIQLSLLLSTLKEPNSFLLCGDSNQIVHPNFFSWSKVKSHFYTQQATMADNREIIRILSSNYRNSRKVTALANAILRLKNARFGSVDRESNYLVRSTSSDTGDAKLFKETQQVITQLNEKTGSSTRFAVIVLYDDYKAEARKIFRTPLVFSIHEAKGLEYANIILYNFVSNEEMIYHEICSGVDGEEIHAGELQYARAKDKSDKSLEIYKFFINALYVAITRAVQSIYLIEKKSQQRIYELLKIDDLGERLELEEQKSSREEWQNEAHKLEMQGKKEQADEIRAHVLEYKPVPWEVISSEKEEEYLRTALASGRKNDILMAFEYALVYKRKEVLEKLRAEGFKPAQNTARSMEAIQDKYFSVYKFKNSSAVMTLIHRHGVEFRNQFNETPLMIATRMGNSELVKVIVQQNASLTELNNQGFTPLQLSLLEACHPDSKAYGMHKLPEIYDLLRPMSMDIQVDGQLVKLECRQMEYFLLNIFMSIFYSHIPKDFMRGLGLCAPTLTSIMAHFSNVVLPERRKSQTYISSILSKNEVSRIGPYNRKLFLRTTKGFYILNPKLSLRIQGEWIPIYAVLKPQHLHFSVEGINLHQSHHESYQQHFKNTVKRCFTAG